MANDARAIALGEGEVRSSLGDPLDLRVPVTLGTGESIEPACFTLMHAPPGEIPRVNAARISVERSAAGARLRIETRAPVNEPAFVIGLVASCPGQSGEYKRDYSLLLDPPAVGRAPRSQAPAPGMARAQPESASLRAIAATLIARIGDTLESIANAIFPRNRGAKKSYIEALRATNPTLGTLGENDPIPIDTPIALPDLRTFAKTQAPRATQLAQEPPRAQPPRAERPAPTPRAATPSARRETAEARAPKAAPAPAPPRVAARAPAAPSSPATPPPRRSRDDPGFVLRLSSPEVDLTRSRAIDDRMRARLRERQLILDADDQVAAVLALRHSVKQLETRVAELQLKLAGMPSSFPPPRAAPAPVPPPAAAPVPPPAAAPAPVAIPAPAATPAPPAARAPSVAPVPATVTAAASPPAASTPAVTPPPAPVPAATPTPPVASAAPQAKAPPETRPPPAAAATPPPAAGTPAPAMKSEPSSTTKPEDRPVVRRTVTERDWLNYGLWVLAVLLLFAAAYLAWRLWQRRREEAEDAQEGEAVPPPPVADDQIVVAEEHVREPEAPRPEYSADGRRIIDADVQLPTRLGNDSEDLRRRYIEERFPEITKGAIVLDDGDSVVKGARLCYEDGAIARAVELLQYAVERNPGEVKAWLALFEIFRLERLSGEFAVLAKRFQAQHGTSPYWPKVQYFGREIDPGNALYQAPQVNTFETIGPTQARRMAAESSFDPIAENWLGAPMDFENEVLANELRKAVMAEAGISDVDLMPNPMPALRNVEMFTVA